MKRPLALFFLVLLLVPMTAFAVNVGIRLITSRRFEFTDCAAGGSAAQTVTPGTYLTRFLTEDIWICYASTCAAAGEKFGAGTALMLYVAPVNGAAGQVMSCRSAGATGDFILTGATQ